MGIKEIKKVMLTGRPEALISNHGNSMKLEIKAFLFFKGKFHYKKEIFKHE
jgi:hypothetical protein